MLTLLFDGVAYGMILFMIAVGLTVTMGLMPVINLAHGGFALIAGATVHWLTVRQGLGFWPAALVAIAVTAAIALPPPRAVRRRLGSAIADPRRGEQVFERTGARRPRRL